ncbi:hypothetical protein E2320_022666 [Naja naja]|nr:hypothetical protein E2320_022666 [Naja naja]
MRENKKARSSPYMNHSSMKSLLFLMSTLCICSSHSPVSRLRFSTFLDPRHQTHLRWDYDDELAIMSFEFQAQSTGWVAFGFTVNKEIPGADFVIGGVLPDGSIYFSGDTLRLMVAFGTNDTIDFFKGKIIHKSLFLMLVTTEEELNQPSVYHEYDLKINDVISCSRGRPPMPVPFSPLPIVKTKHHIYKFEPKITPRNITLVHHIIAYACGNESASQWS